MVHKVVLAGRCLAIRRAEVDGTGQTWLRRYRLREAVWNCGEAARSNDVRTGRRAWTPAFPICSHPRGVACADKQISFIAKTVDVDSARSPRDNVQFVGILQILANRAGCHK